ncbi:hypothetical protein QBC45DRAFT_398478 [Copromyces sp. CBS 386.78]|nr:hypothetical protein QBC45DRAFT_398478 [Copromyces sp. CBS 386.78]
MTLDKSPLGEHQTTEVSVPILGGPSNSGIVPQAAETNNQISGDGEGEDDACFFETIEVPVRVRERPNLKTSNAISVGGSRHRGSGQQPVKAVPEDITKTTRRDSTSSFESLIEEEEVPVGRRPKSIAFLSPLHEENPSLRSVHDQTGGSQVQHRPSSAHKTRNDGRSDKNPATNPEGATSTPNQERAHGCGCDKAAQRPPSQTAGIEPEKWDTANDLRIWKDMRTKLYQKNLVELISPQRPGAFGYLDTVMSDMVTRSGHCQPGSSLTDADFGYRIHFADLQRIQIQYLHSKLVNLAVSAHFNDDAWEPGGKADEIGKVLKEYIQAVRDHEYMGKYTKTSNDPFIATSQRLYDKRFLESAMTAEGDKMPEDFLPPCPPPPPPRQSHQLPQHQQDLKHETLRAQPTLVERLQRYAVPTGPWERDNTDKPASALISTRTKAWKRAYWTRIGATVIGGGFLIAPMWILALQRNLFIHLGVATGCITAFGVSMSLYLETVDNVFAATLAYAAVIMVFVGIVIQETGGKGT